MSVTVDSLASVNPNPSSSSPVLPRRASMAVLQPFPVSMRFESLSWPRKVCISAHAACPIRPGLALPPLHRRGSVKQRVFAFSASHEESKPSGIDSEKEKIDLKVEADESEEAWRQTLESFKEKALKMQSMSREAFELYSKKAIVILLETSEKLKIEAEKARQDLSVVAKEISEESGEYLSTAAEISPESVKEIVETFSSSTDIKEISEVRDFYLGIPYGILLFVSGFLSFMLTGSTSGVRFGVILGGILLALSVSSLRSWKRGESFPLALKGQAAIVTILFLRKIRLLLESPSFLGCFTALFSAAMVAFYVYRIKLDGGLSNSSNLKNGAES